MIVVHLCLVLHGKARLKSIGAEGLDSCKCLAEVCVDWAAGGCVHTLHLDVRPPVELQHTTGGQSGTRATLGIKPRA